MHSSVKNLSLIKIKIKEILHNKQLKTSPQIIAVTKTFSLENITPLLETGHVHFGENKIQEAEKKWPQVKSLYPNLQLHMIGKLQSNKVKKAVMLFDYIHSLDSEKLAIKIKECEDELKKKIKIFIQVSVANESQKSGISLDNLNSFCNYCVKELSLNIVCLMCLPPMDSNPKQYFQLLKKKSEELNLNHLSMGMSSDYAQAIICGSTFLRLGTLIFGNRKTN